MLKRHIGVGSVIARSATVLLLIFAFLLSCMAERGSGRATGAGNVPDSEAEADAPTWLKVGSYNIFQGIDSDRYDHEKRLYSDIETVAETILAGGFDIIGLQEVNVNRRIDEDAASGKTDQIKYIAEYLTEKTGEQHYYCFAPALLGQAVDDSHKNRYGYPDGSGLYGDAVISKYPILSYRVVPMAFYEGFDEDDPSTYLVGNCERRVLLIAEILVGDRTLTFINTHFDHLDASVRMKSVEILERELAAIDGPVVLVGDLNSNYNSDVIEYISENLLTATTSLTRTGLTFPRRLPNRKIDWIFVGEGIGYRNHTVYATGNSDHRPISLEISLTEKVYAEQEPTEDGIPGVKPGRPTFPTDRFEGIKDFYPIRPNK